MAVGKYDADWGEPEHEFFHDFEVTDRDGSVHWHDRCRCGFDTRDKQLFALHLETGQMRHFDDAQARTPRSANNADGSVLGIPTFGFSD